MSNNKFCLQCGSVVTEFSTQFCNDCLGPIARLKRRSDRSALGWFVFAILTLVFVITCQYL